MGGYANGGDADANATAINPQTRLGANPSDPVRLTPAQTAVTCVAVIVFVLAFFIVCYCRELQARRIRDMNNKAREGGTRPVGTSGGESIELKDGLSNASATTDSSKLVADTPHDIQPTSVAPASAAAPIGQKPPLWKYIHWRDPNTTILPIAEALRVSQANPHYGSEPTYNSSLTMKARAEALLRMGR